MSSGIPDFRGRALTPDVHAASGIKCRTAGEALAVSSAYLRGQCEGANGGVTAVQATDNLRAVTQQMGKEHPVEDGGMEMRLVRPGLFADTVGGPIRAWWA